MAKELFYPLKDNMGKDCRYWDIQSAVFFQKRKWRDIEVVKELLMVYVIT